MRKAKRISMHSLEVVDNQQELYALETIAELIVKISLSNFKSNIAPRKGEHNKKRGIMNIEPQQKHKQLKINHFKLSENLKVDNLHEK